MILLVLRGEVGAGGSWDQDAKGLPEHLAIDLLTIVSWWPLRVAEGPSQVKSKLADEKGHTT